MTLFALFECFGSLQFTPQLCVHREPLYWTVGSFSLDSSSRKRQNSNFLVLFSVAHGLTTASYLLYKDRFRRFEDVMKPTTSSSGVRLLMHPRAINKHQCFQACKLARGSRSTTQVGDGAHFDVTWTAESFSGLGIETVQNEAIQTIKTSRSCFLTAEHTLETITYTP